ncbi:hypothetical protein DICPUDRAFT_92230 [Dictyostelium purpureum]|uniref:Uncharacterized protein n=1 Tax=Dictyostelium purpureum TaxID=5786 RepID=F0ZNV3_DICPU|nr:uncharacterized protein DICPUDRAFT_92230 [Dictyostelium purpureum]EGC34358.1 hypothetical protein DICPUDRAFT_92230 [Dictyostelium purpureum]|eukprot:XP_003289092.1 hypothetical protein DICPUDRAFT_92230 [Dictyostelium purpureum]
MDNIVASLLASSLLVGLPSILFLFVLFGYYYFFVMKKKISNKESLPPIIGIYIMRCIYSLTQYWEMIIPQLKMYRIANDHIVFQCLSVVFTLKVIDHLKDGPLNIKQLARLTKSNENNLFRVMRALTQEKFFSYNVIDGTFALNNCSRILSSPDFNKNQSDEMGCVFSMLAYPTFIDAWKSLKECVENGVTGFQNKHGVSFFQYIDEKDTYIKKIFDSAMKQRNNATKIYAQIIQGYDFSPYKRICDIGGGVGHLGYQIAGYNPHSQVFVLELEETVRNGLDLSKIDEVKRQLIEEKRLVFKAGNMFIPRSIPAADLYIMMQVLHDWNTNDSIKILSSVASAMRIERSNSGNTPRLLIIDSILDDNMNEDTFKRQCIPDIIMMAIVGGEERTKSQWFHLLKESGLKLETIKKFNRPPFLSLMEVTLK